MGTQTHQKFNVTIQFIGLPSNVTIQFIRLLSILYFIEGCDYTNPWVRRICPENIWVHNCPPRFATVVYDSQLYGGPLYRQWLDGSPFHYDYFTYLPVFNGLASQMPGHFNPACRSPLLSWTIWTGAHYVRSHSSAWSHTWVVVQPHYVQSHIQYGACSNTTCYEPWVKLAQFLKIDSQQKSAHGLYKLLPNLGS